MSTALALPRGDLWWVALNVISYLVATASLGALWLTGPDHPRPAAADRPQPDHAARIVTASAEPERSPRICLHREPVRPMLVRTDFLGVDH